MLNGAMMFITFYLLVVVKELAVFIRDIVLAFLLLPNLNSDNKVQSDIVFKQKYTRLNHP